MEKGEGRGSGKEIGIGKHEGERELEERGEKEEEVPDDHWSADHRRERTCRRSGKAWRKRKSTIELFSPEISRERNMTSE